MLEERVLNLLSSQNMCVLATIGADGPLATPVRYFHLGLAVMFTASPRDVQSPDLRAGYECAVRFYFRWKELAKRDDARFDGVHVLKVIHRLPHEKTHMAAVVHAHQRGTVLPRVHPSIRDRVIVIDERSPTPGEWASAALAIAEVMCK